MKLSNSNPTINSSQQESAASPVAPPLTLVYARKGLERKTDLDLIVSANYSWGTQALRPKGLRKEVESLMTSSSVKTSWPSSSRVSPAGAPSVPGSHWTSPAVLPVLSPKPAPATQQDAGRRFSGQSLPPPTP